MLETKQLQTVIDEGEHDDGEKSIAVIGLPTFKIGKWWNQNFHS